MNDVYINSNDFVNIVAGETQSLVISILEKKVTLTFTHPNSKAQ